MIAPNLELQNNTYQSIIIRTKHKIQNNLRNVKLTHNFFKKKLLYQLYILRIMF